MRPCSATLLAPCPLPLLLLLLLLLRGPPVLGNEGGAAGSCKCKRLSLRLEKVRIFANKLKSWNTCQDFVQFNLPNFSICGFPGDAWVEELKSLALEKGKGAARAEASEGGQGPTCTSHTSPLSQSSMGPSAGATPEEPPQVQPGPDCTTAVPWAPGPSQKETPQTQLGSEALFTTGAAVDLAGMAGSPPPQIQGAPGAEPTHLTSQTSVAVISLLGTTLLSVAIIVFLLCRKKNQLYRRPLGTLPALEEPGEETLALHRREET